MNNRDLCEGSKLADHSMDEGVAEWHRILIGWIAGIMNDASEEIRAGERNYEELINLMESNRLDWINADDKYWNNVRSQVIAFAFDRVRDDFKHIRAKSEEMLEAVRHINA